MASDDGTSPREISDFLDSSLYPDLVELGGLTAALTHVARESGIDLGSVGSASSNRMGHLVTARVESDRGPVLIHVGSQVRWFSMSMNGDVRPWAEGGTDDLHAAVKAIDAWRNDATLSELKSRFPFMDYDELAQAMESGDHVATQWRLILRDEDRPVLRELLLEVYAHTRLRTLFPSFSMGTLRLTRDFTDRSAGQVWIAPLKDGRYRVESTTSGERVEVESVDQAIATADSFLAQP
ncbi:hypothetical protein FE633_12310 [Streptomyces montanus]|uniref:Uncharacterized protein n=1 Tax=Streptomyces montanus TaxID=2580423 RepID=A0A5R9FPT9_9ACTN|nr:DUF6193 family natural product biosynthesis protein [Streptomyces montanus]TLS45932.1 hypothetical protein FE633_12310 [Streptomyces montanus]